MIDSRAAAALLAELTGQFGVPGAQLAIRWHGKTITAETGSASASTGQPVTSDAAFPLGSLTKPFTATLVMVLADDGDVDPDLPVEEYLPELRRSAVGRVTVRQVLSHTAGLIANVEESAAAPTRQRWLAEGARTASAHPPDAAFSYSNVGYLVAGCLVEAITGMDWAAAVESILLRPLGITPSFALGNTTNVVSGHVIRPDGVAVPVAEQTVTALDEPVAGLAAGAVDLLAFAEAHLGAGPLAEATAKAMREDQLAGAPVGAFGLADGWGLGWSLYRRGGAEWFGHDGTGDGTWSHLRADPASGTVVALLTNAANGVFLWDALVDRLRLLGIDVANHSMVAFAEPGPELAAPTGCADRYRNGDTTYSIVAENGCLSMAVNDEPPLPLKCYRDLWFTTAGTPRGRTPLLGRFLRSTGVVDRLQLTGRLAHRTGSPDSEREGDV